MDGKPHIRRTALAPFLSLSLSLFLSLFLAATSIADTTYRWTDDNGNPVLSDRPPAAGTPFTEIGAKTGLRRFSRTIHISPTHDNHAPVLPASATTMANAPANTAEDARVTHGNPDLCEQARENIFKFETFARMRMRDETGEVRFISNEERAKELAHAYRVRDTYCT